MNYPMWDLPSPGLLIAIVSVLHVFVSHFAVGGGLFLVLAERRARRTGDAAFLDYVRRHSRFFVLLTLVFGAITGVGIWFAITLVHPAATSSLITIWVWAWAIEWTFFATEIAAALVYAYGWDRLAPRTHLAVGWIYFVAAWLSLFVINGILSFMLTPGDWVTTRRFADGFFNATFWPSLVARTVGAMGLAGLYALLTAAALEDGALRRRVARYAALGWVLPMAVVLPLALAWYFQAAAGAGIPLGEIFGSTTNGFGAVLAAAWHGATETGMPFAQRAARVTFASLVLAMLGTIYVLMRRERYGRISAVFLLLCGLGAIGGAEWVREGLRKPFVLGSYMFANGVRLPPAAGAPTPPAAVVADPYDVEALARTGVLAASPWVRWPAGIDAGNWERAAGDDWARRIEIEAAVGREVFRLACAHCHSLDGYNAIRPLVRGQSTTTLVGVIERLATPVAADGAEPAGTAGATGATNTEGAARAAGDARGLQAWRTPHLQVTTWRGRRMPPFAGTPAEARALAVYLTRLGGGKITVPDASAAATRDGAAVFEESCALCHGPDGDWPLARDGKGRTTAQFEALLQRLPEINPNMPPFEGDDADRRSLARYLESLDAPGRTP